MTEFAKTSATDLAKKMLEEAKPLREQIAAASAAMSKGRPTPTQLENDLSALGAHIVKHDDDGSGPDPNVVTTRHMEAGSGAPYQTRQAAPAKPAQPRAAQE